MNTLFERTIKTIESSLYSMDNDFFDSLLNDCINALNTGHKVIASGLGKNVPICEKFVGTMLSLGQNSSFMHTNTAVHGDLGMVNSADVVIVLTKSGKTAESVYLVDLLEKRKSNIWLLSFTHDSILSKRLIDHSLILKLEHEGDLWNILPNNSTTVNLIVLQTLALEIARKRGVTINDYKLNHPGGYIGELLKNV